MSDYLLPELLNDILTRLPVKTLLRCTSVCKSWYSLITSRNFISTHLNRTNHNNGSLIFVRYFISDKDQYSVHMDNETFDKVETLEFPLEEQHCTIIGSSKGLICLFCEGFDLTERIILWNPSIRKYVTLPTPSITVKSHGYFQHTLGFGFDSASNDYKVVRVVYLSTNGVEVLPGPKVEIYELTTGRWRKIDAGDFKYIVNAYDRQALLNGVVHWTGSEDDGLGNWIVSFNLENEAFSVIEMPSEVRGESLLRVGCVAVYRDLLSLIVIKVSGDVRKCCIWVMKEYGVAESWGKQFEIDLNKGFLNGPYGFRENGDALLATVRENGLGDLVSYDLKSKQMKNLGICGDPCDFRKDIYVESLVLIRGTSSSDAGEGEGEGGKKIREEMEESQEHAGSDSKIEETK